MSTNVNTLHEDQTWFCLEKLELFYEISNVQRLSELSNDRYTCELLKHAKMTVKKLQKSGWKFSCKVFPNISTVQNNFVCGVNEYC